MSYLDPHTDSPPPPAYSEEEFDRKTSLAVNHSLTTPQPPYSLDDEWETWPDSAFEAATRAQAASNHRSQIKHDPSTSHGPGGSSSGTGLPGFHPVVPLNIKKKTSDPPKPPPSWLPEAQSAVEHNTAPECFNAAVTAHQLPPDHEANPFSPPPAFTPQGPSLDGPPYEQIMSTPWDGDGSTLSSPPHSPLFPPQQHPTCSPQADNLRRIPRHSLPVPPQRMPQFSTPQRPVSEHPSYKLTTAPILPISTFDPSMAYHQDSEYGFPQRPARDYDSQDHAYNAASLYNVAVATHLRSRPPRNNYPASNHSQLHLASNHPGRERPHDSFYGHGPATGMAPAQNPAAPRFTQYTQYPNTTMPQRLMR